MITVSLETAKKLDTAGWGKRTYFYYCYSKKGGVFNLAKVSPTSCVGIFAPTAQEILDELPASIEFMGEKYSLDIVQFNEKAFYFCYKNKENRVPVIKFGICRELSENLSEGFASLRIRCKENGYLPSKTDE